MSGVFKSQVSLLCEDIDVRVKASLDQPCLRIGATHIKGRQNGSIISVAVIVAAGANADGRREVPGMEVGQRHPARTERRVIRPKLPLSQRGTHRRLQR